MHDVAYRLYRLWFDRAHVILDVLYLEPMQEVDETFAVQLDFLGEFVHPNFVLVFFHQTPSPLFASPWPSKVF